jgi:polysaccharide export outer membrane protein
MKSNSCYFLSVLVLTILFVTGCAEQRNLVYFSDVQQNEAFQMAIVNAHEPKIQSGDILSITVSSLDPTSNAMFNTGSMVSSTGGQPNITGGSTNIGKEGYLVGNDGTINFPVIGKVSLAGLTLTEAHEQMRAELNKYVKEPIVNIRFLNFKITVIGEVNRPASFTVDNDKVNVIEALGMAGDMTAYGQRENVLIIREVEGTRNLARLNLNSSDAFNSPYFYLQQNDVVYVEPSVIKEKQASRNPNTLPVILAIVSITTLIVSRLF